MCQQLYLQQMRHQKEKSSPPPTLDQLEKQVSCYYSSRERHRGHYAKSLNAPQKLISSRDRKLHRLRTLLLNNSRRMTIPFRSRLYQLPSLILCGLFLLLFLLTNSIRFVQSHNCHHYHPKAHEVVHGVRIETVGTTTNSLDHDQAPPDHQNSLQSDVDALTHQNHLRRKKRSTLERPLQISLVYDDSVLGLDTDKFILINDTVLPEAIQFWEQALTVRQTKGPIRLNRRCSSTNFFIKNGYTHCIDSCKPITMCGEVQVPEEHLDVCRTCNESAQNCHLDESTQAGEGIEDADFVFYVSARQTERCHKGLTVAYAAHCQQESTFDRPIAGHANLCPNSISTKPRELQTLIYTVKHEILHALGFSVSLFAFFRDEEGNPRTPRIPETGKPHLIQNLQIHQWSNETIRKVVRDNWAVRNGHVRKEIDMMVTPKVVTEVRKHFGCDSLEGAELEDQGGEGTALTHWEKRVFENEAMTGTHTQSPVFSRITLALMEDSGWYRANYSMASPLSWGHELGCNFVMRSCKDWMQYNNARGRSIHPFCSTVKQDPLQTECTVDRNSVALCNLIRHDDKLPEQYQHFDSINNVKGGDEVYYGGSVLMADHCPYIQEFNWRNNNITIRGSHCHFVENNPTPNKNYALESYGQGSKCFDHGDAMWVERNCRHTREWQHWGSGCYKYNCSDGRLHIQVANYTYTCHFPGQKLSISISANDWLHRGVLICPSCEELCGEYFGTSDVKCRLREEAPPNNKYPQDHLRCGAWSVQTGATLSQYLPLTLAVLSLFMTNEFVYIR